MSLRVAAVCFFTILIRIFSLRQVRRENVAGSATDRMCAELN